MTSDKGKKEKGPLVDGGGDDSRKKEKQLRGKKGKPAPPKGLHSDPDGRVLIVGAGISGLALAVSLRRLGVPFLVLERDRSHRSRRQGYGLTLQNVHAELSKLGILAEVSAENTVSKEHWLFNERGRVLGYYGRGLEGAEEGAEDGTDAAATAPQSSAPRGDTALAGAKGTGAVPEHGGEAGAVLSAGSARAAVDAGLYPANIRLPRHRLLEILTDELGEDARHVVWGASFKDYSHDADDSVVVRFTVDGEGGAAEERTERVSVLVGADGIRSRVRTAMTASTLNYLGVVLMIGISEHEDPLLTDGGFYTLDGCHRLFTMPFDSGVSPRRTMWQLSFAVKDEAEAREIASRDPQGLLAEARRRTAGWHDPVPALIAASDAPLTWATPLFDRGGAPLPPRTGSLSTRKRPRQPAEAASAGDDGGGAAAAARVPRNHRVTLVGDAVHPMSPYKGQGACQSLRDAPHLAGWLNRARIGPALVNFEREMTHRAGRKVDESRAAATLLHSELVFEWEGIRLAGVSDPSVARRALEIASNEDVSAKTGAAITAAMRRAIRSAHEGK